jgi:tetratricopeptide (TPR) repeat protein
VRLHGRVGEALERVYGGNAERHAAQLAFHFSQAAALTQAQERAVRYSVLAAKAAESNHAYEDAISHYQSALSIIRETGQESSGTGPILGQDEVQLLRGLATAQRFANRVPEAFRNFRIAFRMAQTRGEGQLVAELAMEQDRTGFVPADLRVRTLTEGLDAVPDLESELAAMMHARIQTPLRTLSRHGEADEHRDRAREVAARRGYKGVELQLAVDGVLEAVANLRLDEVAVLEDRRDGLEREVGHVLVGLGQGGYWPLLFGDLEGARQRANRYLEALRRTRATEFFYAPIRILGTAYYLEGEFGQMAHILGLDVPSDRRVPDEYLEMARAVLAEAKGDLDETRVAVEAAMQTSTRLRIVPTLNREMVYLAGIERRAGNRDRAASMYHEACEEWERIRRELRSPLQTLMMTSLLALEAAARGDSATLTQCREMLEQHRGLVAVNNQLPVPILVERALGVVAAAEGQWKEAVACLESGETFCREKGLVVELAHCRMALADALMHRNPATGESADKSPVSDADRRRATALYGQALADYQRLGMPLYVQDVLARREVLRA